MDLVCRSTRLADATMKFIKPTRFNLRTLLLAGAVVALAAYLLREWILLRDARDQFNQVWAGRAAGHVTVENVVLTSGRLLKAEAASPWIFAQTAQQRHLDRLNTLLEEIENPIRDASPEWVEKQSRYVRREIDKHRLSPSIDP